MFSYRSLYIYEEPIQKSKFAPKLVIWVAMAA